MSRSDVIIGRPVVDFVLAFGGGYVFWRWLPVPSDTVALALYAALAGIAGLVCGLGGLGLSIQRGNRRTVSLDREKPGLVRRVWVSTLVGAFLGALVPLIGIYLQSSHPRLALAAAGGAFILTVTRSLRLFWLFNAMLQMNERDQIDGRTIYHKKAVTAGTPAP